MGAATAVAPGRASRPDETGPPRSGPGRRRPLVRFLPPVTLLAVLTITASSEYELARTVLALHPAIAWALPVAIDSYVLAALRSGRDVAAALTVMGGALATAMGAHLLDAQHTPLPPPVLAPVATAIMVILVVVAWRVHVLIEHPTTTTTTAAAVDAAADTAPGEYTPPRPEPGTEYAAATRGGTAHGPYSPAGLPPAAPDGAGLGGVRALPRPTPQPEHHHDHQAEAQDNPDEQTEPQRLSDEQILADLRAAHPVEPPSIRALMRTYGIGQNRARRLRNHALTSTDPATNTSSSDHENQRSGDQNQPHQKSDQQHRTTVPRNTHDQTQQESAGMQNEESHTGITDRVGRPRSTSRDSSNPREAVSRPVFDPAFGGVSGSVVDPGGTALLFPQWEAELAGDHAADETPEEAGVVQTGGVVRAVNGRSASLGEGGGA